MHTRQLGNNGSHVSALGLGCMDMSTYGPLENKQDMIAVMRSAVERGITFFDTAEAYGLFSNEKLVGEGLGPIRDQTVIATKFGFAIDLHTREQRGLTIHPDHIKQAADERSSRLATSRFWRV